MKKILKIALLTLIYAVIAGGLLWLSWCTCEILDDLVPRWSMKSYVGPCIMGPCICIYWLLRAAKNLKSWYV